MNKRVLKNERVIFTFFKTEIGQKEKDKAKEIRGRTMGDLNALLSSIEERLRQHDNNRKEVQRQVQEIRNRMAGEADLMEGSFSENIRESFPITEKRVGSLIDLLNDRIANQEMRGMDFLMRQVQYKLSTLETYEVQYSEAAKTYVLAAVSTPVPVSFSPEDINYSSPNDVTKAITRAIE